MNGSARFDIEIKPTINEHNVEYRKNKTSFFIMITEYDASNLPYLPLFYILEGGGIRYVTSITQPFSRILEFKTSISRCCASQF